MNGVLKALCFGVLVTWVAVFQGFYSAPNARGISQATTKTVVYSSLLVLIFDFILTAVMMGGW
jgi:phospholipid/cholesterol/gamma-HCH transport system permease protein